MSVKRYSSQVKQIPISSNVYTFHKSKLLKTESTYPCLKCWSRLIDATFNSSIRITSIKKNQAFVQKWALCWGTKILFMNMNLYIEI